jgi:uncharacterized protein (TIGR04222 family)
MNPFTLTGPQFLLFYVAFAVATVWVVTRMRKSAEGGDPMRVSLTDPYAIAYLRGGPNEALRVASVALVDRGLLVPSDKTLQTKKGAHAQNHLEATLLEKFRNSGAATSIFTDKSLEAATEPVRSSLVDLGLFPGPAENAARTRVFVLGLGVLWAVSGARLLQAFSRGRHNVAFLVILSVFAAIALAAAAFPRRTERGDRLLADIRTLFSGLKGRASSLRPHAGSSEVALLAAVFGVGLLPATGFDWAKKLFPKASSAGTTSSSCGSSCGSSSGSSCGGGCGGGCGGCGG